MFGITPFGMIHTAVSLAAVALGIVAFVKFKEIGLGTSPGKAYVALTVASCITGLFIFHHGGFGAPHALAILTLLVLAISYAGERASFGRASRYVAVVGYSLTFFFHMIPGFTETATRVPAGQPLASAPEDPGLQAAIGGAFIVFLVGATLQVLRLRAEHRTSRTQVAQLT